MISVGTLQPEMTPAYEAFLRGQEDSLVYHSTKYRDLLKEHLCCRDDYLIATADGQIKGVLPLLVMDAEPGHVYNSLPFYGSNGGIVSHDPDAEAALLKSYNERATDPTALSSTMVSNPFRRRRPAVPVHNFTDRRLSQATQLPVGNVGQEAIMDLIDPSARRNVRKAIREGVTVDIDHGQLDFLVVLHRENMDAIGGIGKTPDFFAALSRHLHPGEDFDVYVAKLHGKVIAGLLVLYFNRTVEYFVPATHPDERSAQPSALLLVEAMTHAAQRGFARWNWGGTWETQTGVYRFKRKWGALTTRYDYYTQLNDLSLLNSTPDVLRKGYGHFYVAPYSALTPGVATA